MFEKAEKKKCKEAYKLLHKDLLAELCKVKKRGKVRQKLLSATIMAHLEKASNDFLPIALNKLTPIVFLDHLLSMTKSKNHMFFKSYGGHRSALTSPRGDP